MNNRDSIAVFDSGLGGLTVLKELNKNLPFEKFIYFGDTARVPYGNKSSTTIIKYALNIVDFLLKQKIKLIIIGCNTVSAVALKQITDKTNIPIIDVIKPCVNKAIKTTKNNQIGIIGTKTTIESKTYQNQILNINKNTTIYSQACPLFVPIIEEGMFEEELTKITIKKYLKKIKTTTFDTLILGCTHYPLIKKEIRKYIGKKINIIDSSITTAEYTKKYLIKNKLATYKKHTYKNIYYISDTQSNFDKNAKIFLKQKLEKIIQVHL